MIFKTYHPAVPEEDKGRVDLALFLRKFTPSVFIEVKATGKLANDLEKTERQLRDYNRNNTALLSIITDGREWRFYYSQTGGVFSQKCFKVLDVIDDDLDDIEMFFSAFLSKSEVESGSAERDAEYYLRLNQKQRIIEDALPKARRLVQESPFPSLPQALCELTADAGFSVTQEEAQAFIMDAKPEPAPVKVPSQATAPAPKHEAKKPISAAPQSDTGQPGYISVYRKMLKSPDTLPSRMLQYIAYTKVLTWGELKKACVRELGCKSETSSSIGASLRVLEVDGHVTIDGWGPGKRIRLAQKAR